MGTRISEKLAGDRYYEKIVKRGQQVVINPYHSKKLELLSEHDSRIAAYKEALDVVAQLCEGVRGYVLTGGLAIPATTGCFYRAHRALHLGLQRDELPLFLECMSENNYYLFSRIDMRRKIVGRGWKRDVYEPLTLEEIKRLVAGQQLEKRCAGLSNKAENLRLIQVVHLGGTIQSHQSLTAYLDLYLHWYDAAGYLASNDDQKKRNLPTYFSGGFYEAKGGRKLPLVNLEYLLQRKSERYARKKRETDRYDVKRIKEYLCQEKHAANALHG